MKKIILFLLFYINIFIFTLNSIGQGIVRGKITEENGEALIGVTIVLKSNPSVGTVTDLDGNYSLKITKDTMQVLKVSYLGYYPLEESVHPVKGEVFIKNFILIPVHNIINEVEITAKKEKSKDYFMESLKQKSATSIDYISSETMKKTGDVNVTTAVARVAGVSTNGAFITVRGIGDRYIKTTINGERIPTLDPFTNNIKLDLFPASLIDNVIITKTASPDLPGDWAGAYLSIETKDYPDKLSVNVETSAGYNNQSTFKDVISSQRSSTDWLGYDNGLREHDHTNFQIANMNPNPFQEFVALGLGNYYKSLGINNSTPWTDTYFKLGLVQLGLLAPALINDPDAVASATSNYNTGPYHAEAFNIINAGAAKIGQSFPNNWNTTTRQAPLDFSQSFSIGNQITLFGKPFGFLTGFRYGSSNQYDPNSSAERPYAATDRVQSSRIQQASIETNGWSALFNLAYKFNPNNNISVLFMPNMTGVNKVRNSFDTINGTITKTQLYEQRKQMIYQVKSEQYVPILKLKINADASYTHANSSAPDFKNLEYFGSISSGSSFSLDPSNLPADRYYRYLKDYVFDSHINAELPLGNKPGVVRKIKLGGGYQTDHQKSDQYEYYINRGNNITALQASTIEQVLNTDNFGLTNNTIDWYYSEDNSTAQSANHTFGNSSLTSGFAMIDYSIIPKLRVSGGLRIEKASIFTDVVDFYNLGYAANDERRFISLNASYANPGRLEQTNCLPSLNIIYKLKNNEDAPINLRFNYSQTVARPSIRELSNVSVFDYELQAPVTGNSDLKLVQIYNYDIRSEAYFKNGDNVSLSLFYKDFKNHIELEYSDSYYWQNVDKSYVKGIELECKKQITKQLVFMANVTFAYSRSVFIRTRKEANIYIKEDTVNRPMFGQAPYILNGILSYTFDKIGLITTLSYNVQGPRLVLASNNKSIPDIYELNRNLLDFKISKSINKHFNVSMKIRDLLNAPIRRSYKYPQGYIMDYDKYRYGTSYIFSLSYKL